MQATIKSEIVNLLAPIFGEGVKKIIEQQYDENNAEELLETAKTMLTNYFGEKQAEKLLDEVFKKFPLIKKEVH